MIVTCPMCKSKYSVQIEAIGDGKFVRCSMCGATWQQTPVDVACEKKRRVLYIIKWTCFWFAVFVSIFSLFFAKEAVLKIWPSSVVFYEKIGMVPANKKAFVIQKVSNFFVHKDGKLYMGLRGEIINVSDEVQPLAGITISLKNDEKVPDGTEYKKIWTHDLNCKKFLPNQKVAFETELQSVPYNNLICDIELNVL